MKIAFFCEFYPTPRTPFGGAFFHNFAKGLVRLGHEVWVFRFKDLSWGEVKKLKSFYVHDEDIIDGVHVVSHFIPKVPKWTWLNRARLRMLAQKTFSSIQREKSFDVVHLHFSEMFNSLLGLDLAQRYGLPTICTEHSTGLISQGESEQTLVSARKVLEKVDVLTAVSLRLKAVLETSVQRECLLIDNGIDPELFYPMEKKAHGMNFVSVGFLLPKKNFDGLIRAFKKFSDDHPAATLRIVGGGPEQGMLQELIDRLGLENHVFLLGLKSNHEIASIMRQHDYFVLPSHVETFGVVVLEALFSGLPVLATRCGGPERFVREGLDGVIVDPNDNALLEGLNKLVSQEWDLDRSYFMERYSIIAVARVLEGYYRKMVQRTKTC